uniref:Prosaposin-like n=1 Tax=Astyanax mexicanus TaxID=7994 RepID=A0A8B9RAX2_ASTMX
MTTMLKIILLTFLLIGTVCAMHLELLRVDDDEEHLNESLDLLEPEVEFPGMCWACKWAMGRLKRSLGTNTSKEAVKAMLGTVCDGIGFLKFLCNRMVKKYFDVLVEELSTVDNPSIICSHIGVWCVKK